MIRPQTSRSAGNLADTAIPTCRKTDIAGGVLAVIQNSISTFSSIDYIYVLEDNKLIGVFSIHELFSAHPSAEVLDFMKSSVAYVHVNTDREHVAQLALAQSIKAVPVVDKEDNFVGVILADTVLQILNEDHTNYLYKATGIKKEQVRYAELSLPSQIRTRLPWLVTGLFGGIAGAIIVNFFEHSLADQIFIAAFIPAIVYIADAVGNQSEMLVVRALGRDRAFSITHYLFREWRVGFFISILLGTLMFLLSFVWKQNVMLSIALGLSILATTMFSVTFTVLLPWLLKRLKFDPAVASGPLATVICDVSSVTIYLLIATSLL
ncbi:MAG: magnesium transporter [Patescibacteria group bacterium]